MIENDEGIEVGLPDGRVVADTPLPDGRHRVQFSTTAPMSSYLVAFAVGLARKSVTIWRKSA